MLRLFHHITNRGDIHLSHCGKAQRAKIGQAATNVSLEAEWKHFIEYYTQAFHLALKKAALRK